MRVSNKNHKVILQAAILTVAIVALFLGLDATTRSAIDSVRTIKLKSHSKAGLEQLVAEIEALRNEVDAKRNVVETYKSRSYPSLNQLQELCRFYDLRLDKTERVTVADSEQSGLRKYNTTVHGTTGGLIRFLRKIESDYIFSSERVTMYPVDEQGSVIAISMSVTLQESER